MADHFEIAVVNWEAPADFAAEHSRVFQAEITAYQAADRVRADLRDLAIS